MSQVKQNIRVRFSKQGDIRFTSHHDLMRLFERALRRAQLPVAMSEGYNPRPRFGFPMALGVGVSGLNEVADIGLSEWVRPEEFRARLQAELPERIEIVSAQITAVKPSRRARELSYRVPLLPDHTLTEEGVRQLLARDEVVITRRRQDKVKDLDIRPFVKTIRLNGDDLLILLRCTDQGTARPDEVLEALGRREGLDYRSGSIERTHVNMSPSH